MPKIICLTGISGVGKGYTAKKYCESQKRTLHLVASDILKAELKLEKEQLRTSRKGKIENNQEILVNAFQRALEVNGSNIEVIFDCHMVIDNNHELVHIPLHVFKDTNISQIVFVHDDPSAILQRRKSDVGRVRPERSEADISKQQDMALAVAKNYASELNIPIGIISPRPEELKRVINENYDKISQAEEVQV